MKELLMVLRFLIGGLVGLNVAALLFPGQTIPQIVGVIIGEGIAVVLSTRARDTRNSPPQRE